MVSKKYRLALPWLAEHNMNFLMSLLQFVPRQRR